MPNVTKETITTSEDNNSPASEPSNSGATSYQSAGYLVFWF